MNDLFGLASTVSGNAGYGKALFLQEYSINIVKKSMMTEALDAKRMLAMMPDQAGIAAVVRPQPGDVPAIPKGQYIDVYA